MKKIIFISEGCWFIDSLIYFLEKDIKITMVLTKHILSVFKHNIKLAKELGINIIEYRDEKNFYTSLALDTNTIILGGGHYSGDISSFTGFHACDHFNNIVFYNITKYNNIKECGAKVVRYFNGDTGFGTKESCDFFEKINKYVDTLIFDNDLLKEFVIQNIPSLKSKKIYIGWFETPLERFVNYNDYNKYNKKTILSLGRNLISTNLNKKDIRILHYPFYIDWKKFNIYDFFKKIIHKFYYRRLSVYHIAGSTSITQLQSERAMFFKHHKNICFGLSHMYDIFDDSVARFTENKNFYFSLQGQNIINTYGYIKELYYTFINNPSKDVTYLMNGIIPLISHKEHNIYRFLIENKMAILIKNNDDLTKIINMDDSEIQEYRNNIYKNKFLYTFDNVGKFIMNEFR